MSARFGRNQRRKLRAELDLQAMLLRQTRASLESESKARLEEKRRRIQLEGEMGEWASRIVALAGPHSAFARELADEGIDGSLFGFVVDEGGAFRWSPRGPLVRPWSGPPAMIDVCRHVVDLFAVGGYVERDDFAYRTRFEIKGPDGRAATVMDERTLQTLKRTEDRQLQRYLLAQLIEPWQRGQFR